jgi:hypothetical protein
MNAASVIRFEVFDSHGIRNGTRIEPMKLAMDEVSFRQGGTEVHLTLV